MKQRIFNQNTGVYITESNVLVNEYGQFVDATGKLVESPFVVQEQLVASNMQLLLNNAVDVSFHEPTEQPVIDEITVDDIKASEQITQKEEEIKITPSQLAHLIKAEVEAALKPLRVSVEKETLASKARKDDVYSKREEAASIVEMIKAALDGTSGSKYGYTPVTEEEIDHEDILQEPAYYFGRCQEFTIWDDFRSNNVIIPPYRRPIKFRHLYRSNGQVVNGKKSGATVAMCYTVVKSKKVKEWLDKHTLKDIKFFSGMASANQIDSLLMRFLQEAEREVPMAEFDIITKARNNNVPVIKDLPQLRRNVIMKIAQNKLERHKKNEDVIIPEKDFSKQMRGEKQSQFITSE